MPTGTGLQVTGEMMDSFFIDIENGIHTWQPGESESWKQCVKEKPDGQYRIDLIRVTKANERSHAYIMGCRYLFGVVYKAFRVYSGMDVPAIHIEMKKLFLSKIIEVPLPDGTIEVISFCRSLKHEGGDVNDEELWDFIWEVRHKFQHDYNITVPDPDGSGKWKKWSAWLEEVDEQ